MTTSFVPYLRDNQAELLRIFRRDTGGAGTKLKLFAPVGSGKTTTALALIEEHRQRHPGSRILYLVQTSMLAKQLAKRIVSHGIDSVRLSKQLLRDLPLDPESVAVGDAVAIVVAPNLDDEWFRRVVGDIRWDLVVADEPAGAGQGVEELLSSIQLRDDVSILAVSSTDLTEPGAGWHSLEWASHGRDSRSGLSPLLRVHIAPVVFSQAEQSLLAGAEWIDRAVASLSDRMGWELMADAAKSSPYALQAVALRNIENLRSSRNRWAHGHVGPNERALSETVHGGVDGPFLILLMQILEQLVDQVDRLDADGRLAALKEIVSDEPTSRDDDPVVIFTSQSRTRDYLIQVLSAVDLSVGDAAEQVLAGGQRSDDVLVAFDGILQGTQIAARRGIAYDAPVGDVFHASRLSHLNGIGNRSAIDYWLLADVRDPGDGRSDVFGSLVEWVRRTSGP